MYMLEYLLKISFTIDNQPLNINLHIFLFEYLSRGYDYPVLWATMIYVFKTSFKIMFYLVILTLSWTC